MVRAQRILILSPIGTHLIRIRFLTGLIRRRLSPPSGATRRASLLSVIRSSSGHGARSFTSTPRMPPCTCRHARGADVDDVRSVVPSRYPCSRVTCRHARGAGRDGTNGRAPRDGCRRHEPAGPQSAQSARTDPAHPSAWARHRAGAYGDPGAFRHAQRASRHAASVPRPAKSATAGNPAVRYP